MTKFKYNTLKMIFLIFTLMSWQAFADSMAEIAPQQGWFMETVQESPSVITSSGTESYVNGDRWMHDTLNNAYVGPNAWGFGNGYAGAGTDSNLKGAFVNWKYLNNDRLQLEWFVGGYNRDYNGLPGHGWQYNNSKGGNNVKAYPRMGIGSASGQPNVTSGTPNAPKVFDGVSTVDQNFIKSQVGLPTAVNDMPEIDIHVDFNFSGGSKAVPKKDEFGNYYFAIDSYFHDINDSNGVSHQNLLGSLNAINDSSGKIYERSMSQNSGTTKKWAMMIWYHTPPYYAASGGTPLNNGKTVNIDGVEYFVKYKVEYASDKSFRYVAFVMNRTTAEMTAGGKQPTIKFHKFADFITNGNLQNLLNQQGPMKDVDGATRIIQAPTKDYVLSDINVGVEISTNPDTKEDTTPKPVAISFKELYFDVHGVGQFGFKSNSETTGNSPIYQPTPVTEADPEPVIEAPTIPAEPVIRVPANTNLTACTSNNGQGNLGLNGNYYNNNGTQCQPTNQLPADPVADVPANTNLTACTSNDGQGNLGRNGNYYNNNGTQCQPTNKLPAEPVTDIPADTKLKVCTSNDGQGNLGRNGNYYNNNGTKCAPTRITSTEPATISLVASSLTYCKSNNGKGNLGRDGNSYNNNGTKCLSN